MTTSEVDKKVVTNKSKTYILPLLSKDVDIEFEYLLENTYLKFNINIGDIEYPIGLLYELEDSSAFSEYNDYLTKNDLYFTSYIINMTHKLYIFRFPEKYISEYKLFKEGKYSKFSNEAKSLIISYSAEAYKYPPLIEDIIGVLWKHKSRKDKLEKQLGMSLPKDSELASKIEYDKETFYFKI
jgi:hypothetical protein